MLVYQLEFYVLELNSTGYLNWLKTTPFSGYPARCEHLETEKTATENRVLWSLWIRIRHYFVRIRVLHQQAKKVRKTLICTYYFETYFLLFIYENYCNISSKSTSKKSFEQKLQLMKKAGSGSESVISGTDPRIRIRRKMSWIHNTAGIIGLLNMDLHSFGLLQLQWNQIK
jgi:hypothetical protein